jgi:hypothetical protein
MIPNKYLNQGTGVIASYNYIDIAEGSGFITFQGFSSSLSGSNVFAMTGETIASSEVETQASTFQFDAANFNFPKIIQGTAFISFSHDQYAVGATDVSWLITIQKVDLSGVVTTLGTLQTGHTSFAAGHGRFTQTGRITIPTTVFKIGEHVRVLAAASGTFTYVILGHDPLNRNGTLIPDSSLNPTKFQLLLPAKIDIS